MMRFTISLLGVVACLFCAPAFCADPPTVGEILDSQLSIWEHEITSAVEAMPADKFDFAPTAGEFKGARTFGQQAKHLAAVIYDFSRAVLAEKSPVDTGKQNEGPESLRTKAQIVEYVKGAFTYAHKAMLSLTEKNELNRAERGGQDSMDHYGQMVEYLRMNGIVPPASRPQGQ